MFSFITQFGAEEAASGDILKMLGVDWQLLLFQIVGFVILVFILGKWIFPVFFQIIDKRQALIEESAKAAVSAEKNAEKAQAKIDTLLREARSEARDIVATAKDEASAMVSEAEAKSKQQAEHIVAAAEDSIAKEVIAAKKALHNETIALVMQATEKVLGTAVDAKIDSKVIKSALEEAR